MNLWSCHSSCIIALFKLVLPIPPRGGGWAVSLGPSWKILSLRNDFSFDALKCLKKPPETSKPYTRGRPFGGHQHFPIHRDPRTRTPAPCGTQYTQITPPRPVTKDGTPNKYDQSTEEVQGWPHGLWIISVAKQPHITEVMVLLVPLFHSVWKLQLI